MDIGNVSATLRAIYTFLPGSPFIAYIEALDNIPYLAEINWFVPVPEMIAVLETWVFVIGLWYGYSVILRIIQVIQ